ncbi:14130_t:CDS:2 [Racocetra persica]|uniref:14130_t:CDS:1 n=1 Tax=Racocetra persica TaxID=160502 RepID=A0ACA9LR56_9GLOM|nr:14130_t:CDS:2 [Racocetra persica]
MSEFFRVFNQLTMCDTANTVPNSPSIETPPKALPDSESFPTIRPPFPPVINVEDLISLRESSDGTQMFPSRAPNAFIIYRKQFVKAARDNEPDLFYSNPGHISGSSDINQSFYNSIEYKHEPLEFMQFSNNYYDFPYALSYQNIQDTPSFEPATFENPHNSEVDNLL